jgi:hypothetical protein
MQENNKEMLMDWNDSIENDGQEFVLLPDGEYNFTVTNFERGRFPGGQKIPACNKATITIQVDSKDGIAVVKFDLLLYRSLEWRISQFFRSIGQKKHGEKLTMDWNKVIGSRGRAKFKQRSYTALNGEERVTNDVDRFIDYDETFFIEEDLPF